MESRIDPLSEPIPEPTRRGKGARPRQPAFYLRGHLYRITGVDLTQIDSIVVQVAQTVISEVGVDMSRWKTEKHFASWLGLCPDNRVSGGKVLKHGTRQVVDRAATALRLAAWSLIRSQSALGAKFRRLRSKLGAPKAITAIAHTLARLIYRMLKFGRQYVDQGIEHYENKYPLHLGEKFADSLSTFLRHNSFLFSAVEHPVMSAADETPSFYLFIDTKFKPVETAGKHTNVGHGMRYNRAP